VPKTEKEFLLVVAQKELMKSMDKLSVKIVNILVKIVLIMISVTLVFIQELTLLPVTVHQDIMMTLQTVLYVTTNVLNVTPLHPIVTLVPLTELKPQLVSVHTDTMMMVPQNVNLVVLDVKTVTLMLMIVNLVKVLD
jgi:hypothetical protein